MANYLFYAIVAFIIIEFLIEKIVDYLNIKSWNKPLDKEIANFYTADEFEKAKEYAYENYRFGLLSGTFSFLLSFLFFVMGGFAWLDNLLLPHFANEIVRGLLFFAIIGFVSMLFSLPFECYHTFVIEEKFGFNKMTPSLFITDKIKGIAIGAIIGGLLYALLNWLYLQLGNQFWWAAWITVSFFIVFMAMFYTSLLLPIFNKLVPLKDGTLKDKITEYATKVNFPLTDISVMDGSKRSSKANAFFSGLGKKKSIVLFDTLINDLNENEIVAVMAHEVGHYKRKHILQSMLLSVLQIGILFFVFNQIAGSAVLTEVLGGKVSSFHLSLITFFMLYSPLSLLIGVGMHYFSRKNEYEADAFAKATFDAAPLISSLKKMSIKHLSNLQPHPAYIFLHYSHPTLLQRINALKKTIAQQ